MSDPDAGKYQRYYRDEFAMADLVVAGRGGKLEWSNHDYEAFTYKEPGVSLVFYPHKTSAQNYHIRVRDQNSTMKIKAEELLTRLDIAAGHNCTFTSKNGRGPQRLAFAKANNLQHGWAHDIVQKRKGRK